MFIILLLFVCLGSLCKHQLTESDKVNIEYNTIVTEVKVVEIKADNNRLDIILSITNNKQKKQNILLKTDTSRFSNPMLYADYLIKLKLIKPTFNGNPKDFDYAAYLSSIGINAIAYLDTKHSPVLLKEPSPFQLKLVCHKISTSISTLLQSKLSPSAFAFVNALLIGNTKNLDVDLKKSFRALGISHVLAVSGMHVGVLFLVVSSLSVVFRHKWLELIFSLSALWLFALITGASPSVLRAALVFSLFLIGKLIKKRSHPLNALCFAFILLLVFEPRQLYHAGFQLSFLAVSGILSLSLFQKTTTKQAFWKRYLIGMISTTLAAQAATTPLSILLFHNFPIWFLPANLLIVPLIPFLMYLSLAFLIFSKIPVLSYCLAYIINVFVQFIEFIAKYFDQLPYASGLYLETSFTTVLLIYTALLFLILFIKHRNQFLLLPILLLTFLSSLNWIVSSHQNQHYTSELIIPAKLRYPGMIIFDQEKLFVYEPSDSTKINQKLKPWMVSKKIKKNKRLDISNLSCLHGQFDHHSWLYLLHPLKSFTPSINSDIVILSKKSANTHWQILERISFRILVLDSSVGKYQTNKWKQIAAENHVKLHIVSEQGAFHLKKQHKWLL